MLNFFKRKKNYPVFERLKNFSKKDLYFIRIAEWDWLNKEMITVIDPYNPRVLTFDPWPQYIFIAANGQMTIQEYIYYMADKYQGEIPALLDKTIIDEISALTDEYRIIEFSDRKQRPKHEFELPRSQR